MPAAKRKSKASAEARCLKVAKIDHFRFLELPLELRENIYHVVFQLKDPRAACDPQCVGTSCQHKQSAAALLFTNRQMHAEVWPVYTIYHTFAFKKPLDLANDFLSFLPRQRLACVKHLTLRTNNPEWSDNETLLRFERVWWYYLDVFSGLDSLTFECGRFSYSGSLYRIIPIVLGLLDYGAAKKPRYISRRMKPTDILKVAPRDLPSSYDWVLQIGELEKTVTEPSHPYKLVEREVQCRLVLLQNGGLEHQDRLHDIFGSWVTRPGLRGSHTDGQPNSIATTIVKKYVRPPAPGEDKSIAIRTQLNRYYGNPFYGELGVHSYLANDIRHAVCEPDGYYEVEMVKIAGRWINEPERSGSTTGRQKLRKASRSRIGD